MEKKLLGERWNATGYSKPYQLYRRVEAVAHQLEKRRRRGWVPAKKYIAELYDISTQLKILDSEIKRKR